MHDLLRQICRNSNRGLKIPHTDEDEEEAEKKVHPPHRLNIQVAAASRVLPPQPISYIKKRRVECHSFQLTRNFGWLQSQSYVKGRVLKDTHRYEAKAIIFLNYSARQVVLNVLQPRHQTQNSETDNSRE